MCCFDFIALIMNRDSLRVAVRLFSQYILLFSPFGAKEADGKDRTERETGEGALLQQSLLCASPTLIICLGVCVLK